MQPKAGAGAPATRGRGILKERRGKGKAERRVAVTQRQAHLAVFWHEGPPEGHSSPGTQMASLAPQFTEHPPQLPRGEEGGALQELSPMLRSVLPGALGAVLGGPVAPGGEAGELFSLVAQAASERAKSTPAASDAPETMRQERVLTARC